MFADSQVWVPLAQIIVIDIVLSGDNAVVIALAARNLPKRQQRWAILGGTFGAVALRIVFAAAVSVLMNVPYLRLAGGLLLLWIAVKLLLPENGGDGNGAKAVPTNLRGAIGTIMMADAVMSLDNVIGVAAAAKGSVPLLAIGLAISIPICIFGATLVLRLLGRFPLLVVGGCALLGWIAGDIGYSDRAVGNLMAGFDAHWRYAVAGTCAVLVVIVGRGVGHRIEKQRRQIVDLAE